MVGSEGKPRRAVLVSLLLSSRPSLSLAYVARR